MARKKLLKKEEVEQVAPVVSVDESLRLAQEEIAALKRQCAGLKGENTKLKSQLSEKDKDLRSLRQMCRDFDSEVAELNHLLDYYMSPWYERIFMKRP